MITDVQVYPLLFQPSEPYGDANGIKPYRSTVLIQIVTASGLDGWGECTGALPMIVHEAKRLQNLLKGQDELKRQNIEQILHDTSPRIRAAVDIALWDLLGKRCSLPVHALLGGAVREKVPVYASFQSYSLQSPHEQWLTHLLQRILPDHRMVKMKIGALPLEQDIHLVEHAFQVLSPSFSIAVDANQSYDETMARSMVHKLRELSRITWLEEPMPLTQIQSYTRLKQHATFAIAGGENLADCRSCMELIQKDAVDMIQPDILHIGGITALQLIYQFAAHYNVRCSPHTFDSGLARLATIHVACVAKPYTKARISWDIDPIEWDEMENPFTNFFEPALTVQEGYVRVPMTPGLGVQIDPKILETYLWDPATSLPAMQPVPRNR